MKLLEALEVLKRPISEPTSSQELFLACGFTPLHFKTFLAAHLRLHFPASGFEIKAGLYGNLAGNLERLHSAGGSEPCVVVVEWSDLDPRLGIRALGTWRPADIPDIVESARRRSERLIGLVKLLGERVPVYVSTPTLSLPPIFTAAGSRAQHEECELRAIAASFAASVSGCPRTRVIAAQRLDEVSPFGRRFDPKAESSTGFPYSLEHASRLAEMFATLIRDVPPKKGIITDLDDTLWAGIVGEVGVEGIAWELSRGHLHGLFQRFLDSLASAGVLLAAASKNDSALAEKALARSDMLLPRNSLFPLEINWGPKSASVHRILEQWNIAPDDVVFIDDSPMEVAEVQSSFPSMECIVFPKHDLSALWELLKRLRDSFGKSGVSNEDEVRLETIRATAAFKGLMQAPGIAAEHFLRNAKATVSFSLTTDLGDNRALELINKTNQFNINGRRLSESEWLNFLRSSAAFLLTVSYEDKYGPLGKIAVVLGKTIRSELHVDFWVMSCRAFSRGIEHQCLAYLFEKMGAHEITFDYLPTPRNGPVQSFFTEVRGEPPTPRFSLSKAAFDARVPALFHRVVEANNILPSAMASPYSAKLGGSL